MKKRGLIPSILNRLSIIFGKDLLYLLLNVSEVIFLSSEIKARLVISIVSATRKGVN